MAVNFVTEVSLGQVLQTIAMITAVGVFVFRLEGDIEANRLAIEYERQINKERIEVLTEKVEVINRRADEQFDLIQSFLGRIEDKLDGKADKEHWEHGLNGRSWNPSWERDDPSASP